MITPILERLLLEQKAVYKTHNHGLGGVGTIYNPENRTIIVTEITYYPFIDGALSFDNTPNAYADFIINGRFMHTLKLQAKENVNNWTFKDNYKLTRITGAATVIGVPTDRIIVTPEAPVQHNCFFVANEDIHINLKSFDYAGNIPTVNAAASPPSTEESIPLGYGTSNQLQKLTTVINSAFTDDFGNIFNYFPIGNRDAAALSTATAKLTDFIALQKLDNSIVYRKGSNNFPLVTFGYVELNAKYKISDIIPKNY